MNLEHTATSGPQNGVHSIRKGQHVILSAVCPELEVWLSNKANSYHKMQSQHTIRPLGLTELKHTIQNSAVF